MSSDLAIVRYESNGGTDFSPPNPESARSLKKAVNRVTASQIPAIPSWSSGVSPHGRDWYPLESIAGPLKTAHLLNSWPFDYFPVAVESHLPLLENLEWARIPMD